MIFRGSPPREHLDNIKTTDGVARFEPQVEKQDNLLHWSVTGYHARSALRRYWENFDANPSENQL